jgi:hypothetical protein
MLNIFAFLLFWGISLLKPWGPKNSAPLGGKIIGGIGTAAMICILITGCDGIKATVKKNSAGTLSVALPEYLAVEPVPSPVPVEPREDLPDIAVSAAEPAKDFDGGVIEIKEKMFIAQTNDVYLNPEDYLGKTIKLEGLFKSEQYALSDGAETLYCFVLRYGPGCCGNDGNAGFEVAWDDTPEPAYPRQDDWVEAVGTLKTYQEDGYPYLYLALSSLKVLDEKGAEFVTQ